MDISFPDFILRHLGMEYAWFDAGLRLRWHTPGLGRWLWEPIESIEGRHIGNLFPELVGSEEMLDALLAGKQASIAIQRIHRRAADGAPAYITLEALPYRDGILLLVRDVTEEGRLEQRITQARNELSLLSAQLQRSSERLDTIIRRFVPSSVVDEMLRDESKARPGGERREVSVVFADLRNFTQWAERREPEVVLAMLNHLWAMVLAAAAEFGGTVNQFMGDGVMIVFNAPLEQPEHACRALECARRLTAITPSGKGLRFGIGVNSGPVVVGNVGGLEHLTYTAIGTTTNIAHRLQSIAHPGQAIFGPRTRALAEGKVRYRPLGPVSLKGIRDPLPVFELLPEG